MTLGDYLEGAVLFGLVVLAAGGAAWIVVGRRLAHLDRVERLLAGALIGFAALIAIHLAPLALGILSQATVLVAAAVALAAAFAIRSSAGGSAGLSGRPYAPPSSTVSWVVAGITAFVALAAAAATARHWLSEPPIGVDTLTFHLPNAARWIESGSLWQIDQFIPLQAQGYYPNHGDVLLLATLLPWDNDAFFRVPMLVLFALFPLAVWALGRELGAQPATRVVSAAALCVLPILVLATIRSGMPDILLVFSLAVAALFLARHARTGLRSDLLLAALGLGLALGTKWYGLPAAVVTAGVFGVAHWRRDGLRRATGDTLLLGGTALAAGGIWLVRNVVEVGNPFFPLDSPLFDAPRDVVSERVGFSISDYFTDPDVLFGDLPREIADGIGLLPAVVLVAVVAALVVAFRSREGRAIAFAVAALGLALAYTVTPNTALGFEGDPNEANFNTRYAIPALIAGVGALQWWAGRLGPRAIAVEAALALAALVYVPDTFLPWSVRRTVLAGLAIAVVAAAAFALWRLVATPERRRVALVAGAGVVLLAAVAYGRRTEERVNDTRFAGGGDKVVSAVERLSERRSLRVAIAGDWNARGISPVWPSFGRRIDNDVRVIGYDADGFLMNFADSTRFSQALGRERPDLLIVGRGLFPRPGATPREATWAGADGWQVVARSERLLLLARAPI